MACIQSTMGAILLATVFFNLLALSTAFVSRMPIHSDSIETLSRGSALQLHEASDLFTAAASNVWLATIDGDIAAIPDNEFTTVFAGGIAVMVGGVLSTMIVGFILDRGDLYAKLAAESYLQSSNDEEFWKGLSDEERKKTEEMINNIKVAKGEATAETTRVAGESDPETSASQSEERKQAEASTTPNDMFSDYVD